MPTPTPASKRVFVTSTRYDGKLGGLAGADSRCQIQENSVIPPLGGTWKAWLSSSTVAVNTPARSFTQATVPYKLLNRTTIAANWVNLTGGTLAAPINRTENNTVLTGDNFVWTNTAPNGSISNGSSLETCNDWISNAGSVNTVISPYGNTFNRDSQWTRVSGSASIACSDLFRLYCFEQ